ncbi:hypothetical protein ACFFGT_28005 [Mucilaginibacter angelicae]|uniref:Uncharacterized protein n=1 Tax=Mucilaginibacter angelicae TaxID=869718 RepID=A0ABV6LF54_9SPHI
MKKRYREADIPDLFKIKKPKIDEQQIKNSWESISKKLGKLPERENRTNKTA